MGKQLNEKNSNALLDLIWKIGSGALPGKMLLVSVIENDEFDVYIRSCRLRKV